MHDPTATTRFAAPVASALALALALAASSARAQAVTTETPAPAQPAAQPARAPGERTTSFGVFAGVGYLGIHDVNGGALLAGVRLGVGRHLALGFDLGWGALALTDGPEVQDRWWLMPSVALVLPIERARVDLGVGFGVATASGFDSWSTFVAAPFDPTWAFQLVPAGRLHAAVRVPVSDRIDLFTRLEAGMLFGAGSAGISEGDANRTLRDLSWAALFVGVHYRAW